MSITTPIRLQLNKRFPSYQLYAVAGTAQKDPQEVFKACVLHTYRWLRARFEGFTVSELEYPDPGDASSFDLADLRSASVAEPYPIEVFWLPQDRVWCLRLTEPDNGSTATDFRAAREGVAGRFFETNVGYRVTDRGVECGFRTIVSEPEETAEPVESFRLACIKDIARDPAAGLFHGYKLQDEPARIETSADVKRLIRWIRSEERQLPVIISDLGASNADAVDMGSLPTVEEFLSSRPWYQPDLLAQVPALRPAAAMPAAGEKKAAERVDIARLARYKMGYAQYFQVAAAMSDLLAREFGADYRQGGFTVFEPAAFGGRTKRFDAFDARTAEWMEAFAAGYPSKKPMTFGGVLFASDARELASKRMAELAGSTEAVARAYEERIAAILARHEEEVAAYRARLDDEIRRGQRLEKILENIQEEISRNQDVLRRRHEEELERLSAERESDLQELERYRGRERRPEDVKGIAAWAAEEFAGRLTLHDKAKDLLEGLRPGEWDAGLICDALEFLATDYRDELMGAISEDEMRDRCSRKYGRPFDVTPLNFPSVQAAPKEYKIKYYTGHKGKPVESLLDLHLRVGNASGDLVRVYFLYDKERKLIVVGSLPRHLPTMSYR